VAIDDRIKQAEAELLAQQMLAIGSQPSARPTPAPAAASPPTESASMLRNLMSGAVQIPSSVYNYGRRIYESEQPLSALGQDVGTMAGGMYEGFKQDPLGFGLDMVPVVGEIRSALQAQEYSDLANAAGASGDMRAADMYRQMAAVAAAGAVPLAGTAARATKRAAMSNILGAAPSGDARAMLEAMTVSESANVPNVFRGETISERVPTAVKATEDPMKEMLRVDTETLRRSPEQTQKLAETVQPYTPTLGMTDPDEIIETMKDFSADNLKFIYEQMPPEVRQEARLWYEGANRIANDAAQQYGVSREAAAGVYASLSPQKDWYQNVSLGNRILDIYHNRADVPFDQRTYDAALTRLTNPEHLTVLNRIKGKKFSELENPVEKAIWVRMFDEANNSPSFNIISPRGEYMGPYLTGKGVPRKVAWGSFNEIQKAINVLDNPALSNISDQMGLQHKVRNFYNNIVNPFDPLSITADTHAVAAALMQPLGGSAPQVAHNLGAAASNAGTGIRGTYPIYADAYRNFAQTEGLLPREAQSIAWEGVRGLFSPEQKRNAALKDRVNTLMEELRLGKMTPTAYRDAVLNEAGGINVPDWAK